MPVYARLEQRLGRLGQSRGVPSPPSAEPPRHAAQRHAHTKHTPPTRCEPEDRTTHHQRAKLRRNGGLVSHLSFLPSLEKYFFPDHEVIPASYLGNLVESQPKQLFCYRALVNKGFFAGSSLTKRRMAHAQKRLTPMLRPVPSVSFHLCLSCIFVCVLIYRFTAPALAFIAARPQLSAGLPRSTRVGPPKYMLGCQQHLVFPRGHPSRY